MGGFFCCWLVGFVHNCQVERKLDGWSENAMNRIKILSLALC